MFFSPIILRLKSVQLLCLSNGNYNGLGKIREKELLKSAETLGLSKASVLHDSKLLDGQDWNANDVAQAIKAYLLNHPVKTIITFDGYGVSGHKNHISIYYGVKELVQSGYVTEAYALKSVPVYRKFLSVLDMLPCLFTPHQVFALSSFHEYKTAVKAMFQHSSQLVWFRYLYILFSRFMFINELNKIKQDE
jgi:N-acetylglucosaminylphosphatidylinositol deacetylase